MEPVIQPKKIVQLSEQVFNPVKIPIIINNQIYLMIQQDIRHIEETRHISYAKIDQNVQFPLFDNSVPSNVNNHQFPAPTQQCRTQPFVQDVINCTRNHINGSPGFPFHYSAGTSTSDVNLSNWRQTSYPCKGTVNSSNKSCMVKEVICRGINTDKLISRDDEDDSEELNALEKIKLRKVSDCSSA